MKKSNQRIAAEKAAAASGKSLVYVNWFAAQMVAAGMFSSQVAALEYIASL
jgi:hypothetical protein